ncbi:MAG: alpha/beta-type small acid-soluble spore protein [Firmicutes bacterium]|nr:alpha/beta-type small acid-soluble spore protein [Bacillota bacterium]
MAKKKKSKERRKKVKEPDKFKFETAEQLGLDDELEDSDGLTAREAGKIGGEMVRRYVKLGKQAVSEKKSKKP